MKVIVQRVKSASVKVDDSVVSEIKQGYLLLVGLKTGDSLKEVEYVARKVANLRVFSDSEGKLNLSIKQIEGEILSISQFTIFGDTIKSNRPSFTEAMDYKLADELYQKFNQILVDEHGIPVKTGVFGEHMDVELVNDGPVTIIIEK